MAGLGREFSGFMRSFLAGRAQQKMQAERDERLRLYQEDQKVALAPARAERLSETLRQLEIGLKQTLAEMPDQESLGVVVQGTGSVAGAAAGALRDVSHEDVTKARGFGEAQDLTMPGDRGEAGGVIRQFTRGIRKQVEDKDKLATSQRHYTALREQLADGVEHGYYNEKAATLPEQQPSSSDLRLRLRRVQAVRARLKQPEEVLTTAQDAQKFALERKEQIQFTQSLAGAAVNISRGMPGAQERFNDIVNSAEQDNVMSAGEAQRYRDAGPEDLRALTAGRFNQIGAFDPYSPENKGIAQEYTAMFHDGNPAMAKPMFAMSDPTRWAKAKEAYLARKEGAAGRIAAKGAMQLTISPTTKTKGEDVIKKSIEGSQQLDRIETMIGDDASDFFGFMAQLKAFGGDFTDRAGMLQRLPKGMRQHYELLISIRMAVQNINLTKVHEFFGGALTASEIKRSRGVIIDKDMGPTAISSAIEELRDSYRRGRAVASAMRDSEYEKGSVSWVEEADNLYRGMLTNDLQKRGLDAEDIAFEYRRRGIRLDVEPGNRAVRQTGPYTPDSPAVDQIKTDILKRLKSGELTSKKDAMQELRRRIHELQESQ